MALPYPLLGLAAALALCWACPSKKEQPNTPSAPREVEPNNQASQAQKIDADLTLEAEISVPPQGRDEDWFWLPAALGRWAHVEASPSPGVDVALEIVNEAGEVLLRTNRAGLGGVESIPNVGLGEPRFFRVVSAKDGSGGSYRLSVRFVDAVAEHEAEPNNRLSEASLAPLQVLQQGTLFADDVDWFRFELPEAVEKLAAEETAVKPVTEVAGESATEAAPKTAAEVASETAAETAAKPPPPPTLLRVAVEVEADADAALEIQLCDGEGNVLLRTRPGHRGGWRVRNFALPPQLSTVALRVKTAAAQGGAAAPNPNPQPKPQTNPQTSPSLLLIPYQLKLSLEDDDASFETEPNNTPLQATPLALGKEMQALLSPAEDVDYFRVDVAAPSLVHVELSALEGVDLQLSAIVPAEAAAAERVLLRSNEGKIHEAERLLNVECPGTCYFKVESVAQKISNKWVKTQENPKTPYRIRAQALEGAQRREKEPNNTLEQATELAMGQSLRGYVHPKGDVDFFRVDLSQLLVRKPILATLFGLPKNSLGLWLHRMDEEGKLELVQTAPLPKKDSPTTLRYSATPGVYFLEVKDPKNRESNAQDEYQLRVDWDDAL
ncbi:MAG: hypothetical protein FWD46_00860 [Cystobacterineae bacterium]|nr:hypothetical protein [Cystobacterineae bacterium]